MAYNYPPAVPFTEQLYSIQHIKNPLRIINRQFQKRGPTYSIKSSMIPYRLIFTMDAELARYFLQKNHRNYEKSVYQTKKLARYLGKGLLTNYGDDWKRQRKLIQPTFSHSIINNLKGTILQEIRDFSDIIPLNKTLDFYPKFNRLTVNIVAKALFSSDIAENEIQLIADTLTASQELYMKETFHPLVERILKLMNASKKVLNDISDVRSIIQTIIEHRKQGNPKGDLLDMLMDARYEDTGEQMSDNQLIDELLILFVAGHETTANALSFTFYLLGLYPELQNKLIQETKVLGERAFELDTLFSPSFARHFLMESLRLYPPVWSIDRQALSADQFKSFSWPKDSIIMVSNYHMNRDPNVWSNPDAFIPERFEDLEVQKQLLIPFGKGPRYCIGEHFAMMEMLLVLRHFTSAYTFHLEKKELKPKIMVTLRPDRVIGKLTKQ